MRKVVNIKWQQGEKEKVATTLLEQLTNVMTARTTQIEGKYRRWQDNYNAKPFQAVRTVPFYRASNFVPLLIRMHTDILAARIIGDIRASKPFWKPTARRMELPHEYMETCSEWLEQKSFFELGFDELLDQAILGGLRDGTQTIKWPWLQKSWYRVDDESTEQEITFSKLEPAILAFDDHWVYPITSESPLQVKTHFHRLRLTKDEVEHRKITGYWDAAAADLLMKGGQSVPSTTEELKAQSSGISLTPDVSRPFTAIEAQLDYMRADGRIYKTMITFNPMVRGAQSILRGIYNPSSMGLTQFTRICLIPRANFWYGYSIPEILEMYQEEQAQIHNSRRDASTIGNTPTFKVKNGADVPNPAAEWYPGKTFKLDDMGDLELVFAQTSYNHMMEEEKQVMNLAEQATGVTPPMQGAGAGMLTGKRGIYNTGGTLALLAEGNRRLDVYKRRLRFTMHQIGSLIFYSYRDYSDLSTELKSWSEDKRAQLEKLFSLQAEGKGEPLFFEIGASDASANKETDRTSLLLMSNTMAAYYRQIIEAAGLVAQTPPEHPIHKLLLMVLDGSRDLANRLLFAFDVGDRKRIAVDAAKVLGGGAPSPSEPGAPGGEGVSGNEEPMPEGGVAAVSQLLAQITGQGSSGAGNVQGGPRPV